MGQDETKDPRLEAIRKRLDTSHAPQEILDLARAITGAGDDTLSYQEFEDQLPSYIAEEVGGLPAAQRYPRVKRSLNIFTEREEEYLELLQLAQTEDAGELPQAQNIPPADLSFLPKPTHTLSELVSTLTQDILAQLKPDLSDRLQDIRDRFFQHVGRQGGKLVMVLDDLGNLLNVESGASTDTLLYLAATQLATQDQFDTPHQQIWSMRQSGELEQIALRAALKVGLEADAARTFARQYVISRLTH